MSGKFLRSREWDNLGTAEGQINNERERSYVRRLQIPVALEEPLPLVEDLGGAAKP
jgi:hypothetical protein